MMKTKETETEQKRIENLTLRELDMVYSLEARDHIRQAPDLDNGSTF